MNRSQKAKMSEVALDFWIRGVARRIPRIRFAVECILSGMVIAWELDERNKSEVDAILDETERKVNRYTPDYIYNYTERREGELSRNE